MDVIIKAKSFDITLDTSTGRVFQVSKDGTKQLFSCLCDNYDGIVQLSRDMFTDFGKDFTQELMDESGIGYVEQWYNEIKHHINKALEDCLLNRS